MAIVSWQSARVGYSLGQSTRWVETHPNPSLLVWDYRTVHQRICHIFCGVSGWLAGIIGIIYCTSHLILVSCFAGYLADWPWQVVRISLAWICHERTPSCHSIVMDDHDIMTSCRNPWWRLGISHFKKPPYASMKWEYEMGIYTFRIWHCIYNTLYILHPEQH